MASTKIERTIVRAYAFALGFLPFAAVAEPTPIAEVPVSVTPLSEIYNAGVQTASTKNDPRTTLIAERLQAAIEDIEQRAPLQPTGSTQRKSGGKSAPFSSARATALRSANPVLYSSVGRGMPVKATVADNVVAKGRVSGAVRSVTARQGVLQRSMGTGKAGALNTAMAFLKAQQPILGLVDPETELKLRRTQHDTLGYTQLRFAQHYRGLPVFGAELIAQIDANGDLTLLSGSYAPTPEKLSTVPAVTVDQVSAKIRARLGQRGQVHDATLVVYAPKQDRARLAWQLSVEISTLEAYTVLMDAHDGSELLMVSQIQTDQASGQGVDLFGQTQSFDSSLWESGGIYYMVDTTKPMYDSASVPPVPSTSNGVIFIGDAGNTLEPQNIGYVESTSPNGPWLADGVSAAINLSVTYDYFQQRVNRDSLDGQGSNMVGLVRVGQGLPNAFFDSSTQTMYFGDAEPYAGALDVVAHEMSHGVVATSIPGGLLYHGQSGAMNEAFADIFGELTEGFQSGGDPDWLMGSRLSNPLRNLADPGTLEFYPGRPYPSRMSEFVAPNDPVLNNFANRDSDGVHINSSIINRAFYLLMHQPSGGTTRQSAEEIIYRTLTTKLSSTSDFIDLRLGAIQSAVEGWGPGSNQVLATEAAFDAVEIFDAPTNPTPPSVPPITGQDATLFVYWDSGVGDYYLGRLDPAFDTAPGIQLSANPVSARPPSVAGDGSFAVFVDAQNDICLVATDASAAETCLGFAGQIGSVAVAADGETFGVVFLDAQGDPTNSIGVIDVANNQTDTYSLVSPVADGVSNIDVLYADAMDFTSDNRYIIYDAFNAISFNDGNSLGLWSIYAIDRATGSTVALTNPAPGINTGFPNVAQTSNAHMVFDAVDEIAQDTKIVALNVYTGDAAVVAVAGFDYTAPVYTGDDTAIVFSAADNAQPTLFSLASVSLGPDRITPIAAPQPWLADAVAGSVYRRGTPASQVDVDVEVTYTVQPPSNHIAQFNLNVRNVGSTNATGLTWTVSIPPNVELFQFFSGGTPTCTVLDDRIECEFGDPLPAGGNGESPWFQFRLLTNSAQGDLVSSVTAFASEADVNTLNNTALATIDESALNIAPVVVNAIQNRTLIASTAASFTIAANFIDPDDDSLTYLATGLPASLSLNSSSGVVSGTPTAAEAGNNFSVNVAVTDPFDATVNSSFSITVNPAPQPPPPQTSSGGGGSFGLIFLLSILLVYISRRRTFLRHAK